MATTDGRCQLIKSKHNIEYIGDRRSHESCLGLDLMDRFDCSEILGRVVDKTDTASIIIDELYETWSENRTGVK